MIHNDVQRLAPYMTRREYRYRGRRKETGNRESQNRKKWDEQEPSTSDINGLKDEIKFAKNVKRLGYGCKRKYIYAYTPGGKNLRNTKDLREFWEKHSLIFDVKILVFSKPYISSRY